MFLVCERCFVEGILEPIKTPTLNPPLLEKNLLIGRRHFGIETPNIAILKSPLVGGEELQAGYRLPQSVLQPYQPFWH